MRQRIRRLAMAGLVIGSLLVSSIETLASSTAPCKARLSQAEAIGIANKAAALAGFALRDFGEPTARFGSLGDAKSCAWSMFYYGKTPTLGNHFVVFVDDQTET